MARQEQNSSFEAQIEANLKKVYEKTVQEPVPDRFAALLAQLKEQDAASSDPDAGDDGENSQ
ncbi:NepR family anti-sigma factor [Celeribacter arenosi]|uniref:Anti-sigma factor NepR domain-containing protein n=1 Tax=Celeribacter arenosi TaxID=792649 RepID=A0ABP7JU73_9RHOB